MKKQYAVFGLGSFGESVAIELQKLGCEVLQSMQIWSVWRQLRIRCPML